MSDQFHDANLFMLLERVNPRAFSKPPAGYRIRPCRPDELPLWKRMVSDGEGSDAIDAWLLRVYGAQQDRFFEGCRMAVTAEDDPVGTCLLWKAYGAKVTTLNWFRVLADHEGRRIGRALLTALLEPLASGDLPVLLATQATCARAIKLYTDFGFKVLTSPETLGRRPNEIDTAMAQLEDAMPARAFYNLQFTAAPQPLVDLLDGQEAEF